MKKRALLLVTLLDMDPEFRPAAEEVNLWLGLLFH